LKGRLSDVYHRYKAGIYVEEGRKPEKTLVKLDGHQVCTQQIPKWSRNGNHSEDYRGLFWYHLNTSGM